MADKVRAALMALYLDVEAGAVASYETCTYPGGVFNDRIWRKSDAGFDVAKRARGALGLRPFRHRDAKKFGLAGDRLDQFRAKERANG